VSGTLGIYNTFWLALNIRISCIVPDTRTAGGLINLITHGINTAWRGITWLYNFYWKYSAWLEITAGERISDIALVTHTDRDMVTNSAVRVYTTETRAWVLAFPVNASSVCWTVGVNLAFRAAVGRTSNHLRQARTLTTITYSSRGVTVGSTGVRVTWISLDWFRGWWWFPAGHEWVSNISLVTNTYRQVVSHLAVCI